MSSKIIKSKNVRINVEMLEPAGTRTSGFVRSEFAADRCAQGGAVRNELEKKLREARQEAYDKGLAEGVARGTAREQKRLAAAAGAMAKLTGELEALKREAFEGQEEKILELAFAIAEKVVHGEAAARRDVVLNVLKAAAGRILDKDKVRIRISPKDYDRLAEVHPSAVQGLEALRSAVLEKDDSIRPGGAVIETPFGEVDARLDSQLAEVRSALYRACVAEAERSAG